MRLTAIGKRLEQEVRAQAATAEDQIAAMLGTRQFTQLRDALHKLVDQLDTLPPRTDRTPPTSP